MYPHYLFILLLINTSIIAMEYDEINQKFKNAITYNYSLGFSVDINQLREDGYDEAHITYAIMSAVQCGDWDAIKDILPNEKQYAKHLKKIGYPSNIIQQEINTLKVRNNEKRTCWTQEYQKTQHKTYILM